MLFSTAVYNLDRTNQPVDAGNNRDSSFRPAVLKSRASKQAQQTVILSGCLAVVAQPIPIPTPGSPVRRRPPSSTAIAQYCPTTSSPGGTNTSSTAVGAALGVIYFSDSFASSDDSVRLPGFVRFDTASVEDQQNMESAAQCREHPSFKGYWASADGNNNISPGQCEPLRCRQGRRSRAGAAAGSISISRCKWICL